jgi:hypothetical protein
MKTLRMLTFASKTSRMSDLLFEELTPLGFSVRVTTSYWGIIATIKHPIMEGRVHEVQEALRDPDEIRMSKSDPSVFLFYRTQKEKRWVVAVTKHMDETEGFLITAYLTDAIKTGKTIWQK